MAKKPLLFFAAPLIILTMLAVLAPSVSAHCPLCTAAVGAAAVSAKYYGLDASIIGLLVGAFGLSTGLWIGLKIRKEFFKLQLPIIVLASFLLTAVPLLHIDDDAIYSPLLLAGKAGSFLNRVYWVNKIFLGSVIGALITLSAYYTHIYIKKINGKVLFPFQGIAITLALLLISALGLYFNFG